MCSSVRGASTGTTECTIGVVVDVDEVERLRAVLRAGAADGNREVLRVAGR